MHEALRDVGALRISGASFFEETRVIPEETPVALVYDGTTHAVMMASPADLEDFALGFSLTEGKIGGLDDVVEMEIVAQEGGIEARMWLRPEARNRTAARHRATLGPTGCGLCGIDSLAAALPEVPVVASALALAPAQLVDAVASMQPAQVLNAMAHALHAAGFWTPADGLVTLREDVGRHNALDKLVGAVRRAGTDASAGVVVLTSRLSVEMVQKVAVLGAPVIAAVSAPTALALRTAETAGITVVAVARGDGFEAFTRRDRIMLVDGGETRRVAG